MFALYSSVAKTAAEALEQCEERVRLSIREMGLAFKEIRDKKILSCYSQHF
jgi:hypothetical protein